MLLKLNEPIDNDIVVCGRLILRSELDNEMITILNDIEVGIAGSLEAKIFLLRRIQNDTSGPVRSLRRRPRILHDHSHDTYETLIAGEPIP